MAKRTTERRIANRYVLKTPLGRGGMGVVWRAEDTLLAREVAIKEVQLPPSLSSTELTSIRARVLREARAAARLNHPGAVTLYDVVQEEGHTYIVMELVEASTLAQLVRERGPLPPDQVAALGLQVLDALRAAHRVGIVHRDVKPGNVMVTAADGRAKLADFGIASLAGDPQLTSTGLVLGSPAFMAPEQASGKPSGPPTDLWALGATMYYAVEGEPPFEREGTIPTLTAVVHDPPRPLRLARALAPVILGLLAKSPAERPSAGQLQRQLEQVVGDRGDDATASHPTVPAAAPAAVEAPAAEDGREATVRLPAAAPVPHPAAEPAAAAAELVPEVGRPADDGRPAAEDAEAARPSADDLEVAASQPAPPPTPVVATPQPARVEEARPARRGLWLAVAVLAVVGVLAAVLLSGVFSDRGGRTVAPTSATSAPAGGAKPAPTTIRAPGTTAGPPPTAGSPSTAGQGVPAGWKLSQHPDRGFALAVPESWRVNQSSRQVSFEGPEADTSFFVQSKSPPNDLRQAGDVWEGFVQDRHGKDGLQWLSKGFGTFQGNRAYVLEYTYRDRGRLVRERDVNVALGNWGYALVFHAPDADWERVDRDVWSGV